MRKRPLILLIDDEHLQMLYFVEELQSRGCCVEQRTTVNDALSYLASFAHLIEGIILDWMLPHGGDSEVDIEVSGGRVILDYLTSGHPGIPVIVFSNATYVRVAESHTSSVLLVNKCDYHPNKFCDLAAHYFGIELSQ